MQPPQDDLERQLGRELKAFYNQFGRYHALPEQERQPQFEQPLDMLAMRWGKLLHKCEQLDLQESRTAATKTVNQAEIEAKRESEVQLASKLRGLSPENQVYVWNSSSHSDAPSPLTAPDREARANAIYEPGSTVIQERYQNLKEMLSSGIEALENGQEPSLSQALEGKLALENQQSLGVSNQR